MCITGCALLLGFFVCWFVSNPIGVTCKTWLFVLKKIRTSVFSMSKCQKNKLKKYCFYFAKPGQNLATAYRHFLFTFFLSCLSIFLSFFLRITYILRRSKQIPFHFRSWLEQILIGVREATTTRSHATGEALYLSCRPSDVWSCDRM